jgi:ABC-type multidrug transport system ATPase subunit
MSILSGTLLPSAGSIFVTGCDLSQSTAAIHQFVGVCPQFDVVWHDLTVSEHLAFQARQRGVPSHRVTAEVQVAAAAVGLDGDGFKTKAGELSGGMRRRLSIAMSVVGNPPVIFMDGTGLVSARVVCALIVTVCSAQSQPQASIPIIGSTCGALFRD